MLHFGHNIKKYWSYESWQDGKYPTKQNYKYMSIYVMHAKRCTSDFFHENKPITINEYMCDNLLIIMLWNNFDRPTSNEPTADKKFRGTII